MLDGAEVVKHNCEHQEDDELTDHGNQIILDFAEDLLVSARCIARRDKRKAIEERVVRGYVEQELGLFTFY